LIDICQTFNSKSDKLCLCIPCKETVDTDDDLSKYVEDTMLTRWIVDWTDVPTSLVSSTLT